MKNPKEVKKGKLNRSAGKRFELFVRKDLEESGWIVDRWNNKVELGLSAKESKEMYNDESIKVPSRLVPAKSKWNNFTKSMMMGSGGMPDFIAFRRIERIIHVRVGVEHSSVITNEIIGIECKTNGILDKEEKEQIKYYLDNNIFSKVLIAVKKKEGRKIVIEYRDAKEYLERMK